MNEDLNEKWLNVAKKQHERAEEYQRNVQSTPFLGELIRNDKGVIKKTHQTNVELILENDPIFDGVFQKNLFTEKIDVMKDVPELHIFKGQLLDDYLTYIVSYIEKQRKYNNTSFDEGLVLRALKTVAIKHAYNPIVDYMEDAFEKWDKTERLKTVFNQFLGARLCEETELIAKLFFVGGVAKAYNPETKFDFVLDLVGGQGVGKTTFLKKIAPCGYYTDQFKSFEDKDDKAVILGAFIANDDEMKASNDMDFEELKKFVTAQEFTFRAPYDKTPTTHIKKCLLVRTTNELYYLKDKTGSRRFLPIKADGEEQKAHPVEALNDEYVQQLWGEAVNLYKQGFKTFLSKEQESMMEDYRESFLFMDEVEERLEELLYGKFKGRTFITSEELAFEIAPGVDLVKNAKLSRRINNAMVYRFAFEKGRGRINGVQKRGFVKKSDPKTGV